MHRELYHESMDLRVTKGNVNGEKREMTNGQVVSMLERIKGRTKQNKKWKDVMRKQRKTVRK